MSQRVFLTEYQNALYNDLSTKKMSDKMNDLMSEKECQLIH